MGTPIVLMAMMIAVSMPGADPDIVENQKAKFQLAAVTCPAGKITCAQWCQKYWRRISSRCKKTGQQSCIKRFGSVDFCVPDKKPKRQG